MTKALKCPYCKEPLTHVEQTQHIIARHHAKIMDGELVYGKTEYEDVIDNTTDEWCPNCGKEITSFLAKQGISR